MSTPTLSTETASRASPASWLSSFTNGFGAGGGLSSLFQNLLTTAGGDTSPARQPLVKAPPLASTTNDMPSMRDIMNQLHSFMDKWHDIMHDQHANHRKTDTSAHSHDNDALPSTSAKTSGTSPDHTTTDATPSATQAPTDTTQAQQPSDSASSDDGATDTAPVDYAAMTAELQALLALLQKKIQAAKDAAGTAAGDEMTESTSTTDSMEKLMTAGNALADLLALAQMFEKKFVPSSSDATKTDENIGMERLAALDTSLKTNLKDLLDQLKNEVAKTVAPATEETPTSALADDVTTQPLNILADATEANNAPAAAAPEALLQRTLATADDFMKHVEALTKRGDNDAQPLPPAFAALANHQGDTSFETNSQDNHGALSGQTAMPQPLAPALVESGNKTNPYSFAGQLSAMRAQNGGTTGLQNAVEQVMLHINRGVKGGDDEMKLQLHPADLGTITIKLNMSKDGSVTGTVTASNQDTLTMLQKDSRSLERALQDAGLRADPGSLEFSLGEQQQQQNAARQSGDGKGAAKNDRNLDSTLSPAGDENADESETWVISPNRVNLKV